jgi:hypothetical protein
VLQDDEIAVLLRVCRDHEVLFCLTCQKAYKPFDLLITRHVSTSALRAAKALRIRFACICLTVATALIDQSRLRIAKSRNRIQRNVRRP